MSRTRLNYHELIPISLSETILMMKSSITFFLFVLSTFAWAQGDFKRNLAGSVNSNFSFGFNTSISPTISTRSLNKTVYSLNAPTLEERGRDFINKKLADSSCPAGDIIRRTEVINNYCTAVTGGENKCLGLSSELRFKCSVSCAVSSTDHEELAKSENVEACKEKLRELFNNARLDGLHLNPYETDKSVRSLPPRRSSQKRSGDIVLEKTTKCNRNKKYLNTCDAFENSELEGNSLSSIVGMFTSNYQGDFNESGVIRNLVLGDAASCKRCMMRRFAAVEESDRSRRKKKRDFRRELEDLQKETVTKLATKKANEAISEYMKFSERNAFMNRYFGVERKTCDNLRELKNLPRGCNPKAVLEALSENHKVDFNQSPEELIGQIISKHKNEMFNAQEKSILCHERIVNHDNYLSALATQINNDSFKPSFLFDEESLVEIDSCDENDQKCLLKVIAKSKKRIAVKRSLDYKDNNMEEMLTDYIHRSPFFRTLLSSKQSIKDYASSGDLSEGGETSSLSEYMRKNKERFIVAGERDSAIACEALSNDLKMAICSTEDNFAENYSGEELKTSLISLAYDSSGNELDTTQPEFFIKMGTICEILNSSSTDSLSTPKENSKAYSDRVVDSGFLADTFVRLEVVPAELGSDSFRDFASALCVTSNRERRRQEFRDQTSPDMFSSTITGVNSINRCLTLHGEAYNRCLISGGDLFSPFSPRRVPPFAVTGYVPRRISSTFPLDLPRMPSAALELSSLLDEVGKSPSEPVKSNKVALPTGLVSGENPILDEGVELISPKGLDYKPTLRSFTSTKLNLPSQLNRGPANVPITIPIVTSSPVRQTVEEIRLEEDRQERQIQELMDKVKSHDMGSNVKFDAELDKMRKEFAALTETNSALLKQLTGITNQRKQQNQSNIFEEDIVDENNEFPKFANKSLNNPIGTIIPKQEIGGNTTGSFLGGEVISGVSKNLTGFNNSRLGNSVDDNSPIIEQTQVSGVSVGSNIRSVAAAAGNGDERLVSKSFVPSTGLQQVIPAGGSEIIPTDKKVELLKEFLSYVETNPSHRNGEYLGMGNDEISIDYQGTEIVIKVDDITDNNLRVQFQERLIKQRLVINQNIRQARFEELRRRLASANSNQQ